MVERDPNELLRTDEVELEVAQLGEHLNAHLTLAACRPSTDSNRLSLLTFRIGALADGHDLSSGRPPWKRAWTLDCANPFRKR